MASKIYRPRYESENSNSSTDSSLLDGSEKYAVVDVLPYCRSDQQLLGLESNAKVVKESKSGRNLAVAALVISVVCLLLLVSGCLCFFFLYHGKGLEGIPGFTGGLSATENEKVNDGKRALLTFVYNLQWRLASFN
jgi:hypothetical protein